MITKSRFWRLLLWPFVAIVYSSGTLAAQRSFNEQYELWQKIQTIGSEATAVCFAKRDSILAVGYADGTMTICKPHSKTIIGAKKRLHGSKISQLLPLNDLDNIIFSGGYDGLVKRFDLENPATASLVAAAENIGPYAGLNGNEITSLALDKNATQANFSLAWGGYNAQVWKTSANLVPKKILESTEAGFTTMMTAQFGPFWVAASGRKLYRIYHQDSSTAWKELPSEICELTAAGESSLWGAWQFNGTFDIYEGDTLRWRQKASNTNGSAMMALSADGRWAYTGNNGQYLTCWNIAEQKKQFEANIHGDKVRTIILSKDAKWMVTGAVNGEVYLWKKRAITSPDTFITAQKPKLKIQATITSNSQNIILALWDAQQVDGDIVSIWLNEKQVSPTIILNSQKKIINLQLKKGNNILVVKAHNEGRIPPNTANIELRYGNESKELKIQGDSNSSGAVSINVN